MGKPRGYVICGVFGILLGLACGYRVGNAYGQRDVRVEAIKAGHARYMIMDEYGNAQFEWILVPPGK